MTTDPAPLKHQFLWLDFETTGLDPFAPTAAILEWAIVLAADAPGDTLEPVEQYTGVVRQTSAAWRGAMDPYVVAMHTANGLIEAVEKLARAPEESLTIEGVDQLLLEFCENLAGPKAKIVLAGGSVHFDLGWARVHLPRFASRLSSRVCDVSTLKAVERAWFAPFGDIKAAAHRALPDALASLAEARRWRDRHAAAIEAAEAARPSVYGPLASTFSYPADGAP